MITSPQQNTGGDFKRIKNLHLSVRGAIGKRNRSISLELPRDHKPKGQELHKGTFLTLVGACENGLEQEDNECFDELFAEYGKV